MDDSELKTRYKQSATITLMGAICNIFLAGIKCLAGWLGNSHALFADGIHSLSDLFADGIVLLAAKFGNEKADCDHPYGHHRIETAATIAVALFLLSAGGAIILSGTDHLLHPEHDTYIHPYVLWIAILALGINESIYWITIKIARKIQSDMLIAHAWHRRSDAAASLIVLVGIIGSMLGFYYWDGVAAILVGLFILKMAWQMGRKAFDELIDRGVGESELKAIKAAIQQVNGVVGIHQLRTRLSGGKIIADVHLMVNPFLSVSEGHYISEQVYFLLQKDFPNLNDVTVHVDSEDDELVHHNLSLPSREKIVDLLRTLQAELPYFEAMQIKMIHYLGKKLVLELLFPVSVLAKISKDQLQADYTRFLHEKLPNVDVRVFFS